MKEIPAMTNAQDVSAPSRLDDVQASIVADLPGQTRRPLGLCR
jgi:hypothetical protein